MPNVLGMKLREQLKEKLNVRDIVEAISILYGSIASILNKHANLVIQFLRRVLRLLTIHQLHLLGNC